ncbi:MAG TPA: tetratricopeptide repeat protein [Bacteroidia bacterium]|jgi:tetratricopeptide (TPR) repeat protein
MDRSSFFERHSRPLVAVLLLITAAVYFRSLGNNYLNYDDPQWLAQGRGSVIHAFISSTLNMYAPLVDLSFRFDAWTGNSAVFSHAFNLFLHLMNVLLVFIFIKRISKNEVAFFTAAMFALYPGGVDSVGWVSTRSNLMFTFFFLLSLVFYTEYVLNKSKFIFAICLLLFICSCLCKSAAVALPVILLLLDHLMARKLNWNAIFEKIPFFLVASATIAVAILCRTDIAQTHSAGEFTLVDKFFMIAYSVAGYFLELFWPVDLCAIYSYPVKNEGVLPVLYYISPLFTFAIIAWIWAMRKRREVLFGGLFFLFSISPCLAGFFEDGYRANRYCYLPYIGLFFLIAGIPTWFPVKKNLLQTFIGGFLIAFSVLTFLRIPQWKNDLALFTDVIARQPGNAFAYNSRGIALYYAGKPDDAIRDYTTAIHLSHDYAEAYSNRGRLYYGMKEFEKAIDDYNQAIAINPNSALAYLERGNAEMDGFNDNEEAIKDYSEAIRIDPDLVQAWYNRGMAELHLGKNEKACSDLSKVKALGYTQADEILKENCK